MRARAVGWVSVCLGGLALAAGPLVAALSPVPVTTELPLDAAYSTEAVGSDVVFLDPVTLEERAGQDVSVSVRVRGDADSGDADADTAVWRYDTTTSATDGTLISTTTTTACLDRRTAEAVDCAVGSVDGVPTDVHGLTVAFPPGTRPQDRSLWNDTVRASRPLRFVGTERFSGLAVQRWQQVVPEQVIRTVTVPGLLLSSTVSSSPADVLYSSTRDLLVEPVSGTVVSTEEVTRTVLRAPDGTLGAVLLGGTFTTSAESADAAVARARDVLDREDPLGSVVAWGSVATGVVLLVLGVALVVRGRRPSSPGRPEDVDVRPAVPAV